jgi:cellulose synthase/poly-beta-1,6-N-acetylglucosamine synthase-like glycosyltransferase
VKLLGLALLGLSVALAAYTYVAYPLLVALVSAFRRRRLTLETPTEWPSISITLAAYNEAARIRDTLESLLRVDYPPEQRQILVISDASTDGTDAIVAEFASRGIGLLRMAKRGGKDAAENAALPHLRGSIIVNTDASVRIQSDALKRLISAFGDPSVGVASGRDLSVADFETEANLGESKYVGYEMWLRSVETRAYGIVGASGCFYAVREQLHRRPLPEGISRDFAAAMIARERGYRSVSVDDALCLVPRQRSLRREYARKVRTMTRGLRTLLYKRQMLNPLRYDAFAWMLFGHKLCRWLVPWTLLLAVVGLATLAPTVVWARWAIGAVALLSVAAISGLIWPRGRDVPGLLALASYFVFGNVAALHAWMRLLSGGSSTLWEPTRRAR